MSCTHKTLFGEPNKGVHSYRVGTDRFNVAAIDLGATVLVAIAVSYFVKPFKNSLINFFAMFAFFCLTGVIAHRVFCVETAVDRYLFGGSTK